MIVRADPNNEYRLSIIVDGHEIETILDTGFTHPRCFVGLALDESNFRAIRPGLREIRHAGFHVPGSLDLIEGESGLASVSIVGLDGSQVLTRVVNAGENILGVCYFHQLVDFEVLWDLGRREMSIRRRG